MITPKQALYLKEYILLRNKSDDISKISRTLFDSKISLNPHQITAAVSFFSNPLSLGTIFADEVGLGKTIEAGIVISQYWYEFRRRIIIICPASLMKQWNEELLDKFHLDSEILDRKRIEDLHGALPEGIYIVSINTAYLNADFFKSVSFDLVVIDEAHKLRNVYKQGNVMANAIKNAFSSSKKLLLTATPIQNNLMEMYGLFSLLDTRVFPDEKLFRDKYVKNYSLNKDDFKKVVETHLVRTLRKDVEKYINYTNREVMVADYYTTPEEQEFYSMVSNVLYSNDFSETYTIGQNQLMIILLQKLLSSSRYAVLSTLQKMHDNLDRKILYIEKEDEDESSAIEESIDPETAKKLQDNIHRIIEYGKGIEIDSKLTRLLMALESIFDRLDQDTNRNKKVLIFTESKRTQEYLYKELKKNDRFSNVLTFNGDNNSKEINDIYNKWIQNHNSESRQKSANLRRAIIDSFENQHDILIATDAAAEGLNMQFCSVVINYDLPWNPQRIEQRIGRCHRFGQKNDVIVVNMLNRSSSIDERIYELLNTKIGIFDSAFGSSDIILNGYDYGDDLEKAIKSIYTKCRSPKEIEEEFIKLQKEFSAEIEQNIKASEEALNKYFDEEVKENFELKYIQTQQIINEYEEILENLLIFYLGKECFNPQTHVFNYMGQEFTVRKNNEYCSNLCNTHSEIGRQALNSIEKGEDNPNETIVFLYEDSTQKIGYVDEMNTKTGHISVSKVEYRGYEITDALVITAIDDAGGLVPQEVMHKLLKGNTMVLYEKPSDNNVDLSVCEKRIEDMIEQIATYNNTIYNNELNSIDSWADNLIEAVQLKVEEMRQQKKSLQTEYLYTSDKESQIRIQNEINDLSKRISKGWQELANKEDEINDKRVELINKLKAENNNTVTVSEVINMRFAIK